MQERCIQRLGQDLVVTDQQKVGGAGLLYIAVRTEQYLVDAVLLFGVQRRAECGSVITAGLGAAKLFGRAGLLVLDQQFQCRGAAGKIITDR